MTKTEELKLLKAFFKQNFSLEAVWDGVCENFGENPFARPTMVIGALRRNKEFRLAWEYELVSYEWLDRLAEHLGEVQVEMIGKHENEIGKKNG